MADRAESRALLIYDGECALCRRWADARRRETGDRVVYATAREIAAKFPDIPLERYRRTVQLIDADGRRHEGARAVFLTAAMAPGRGWIARAYEAPAVAPVAEAVYRFVARHRSFFSRLTGFLWGDRPAKPAHGRVAWLFLRALSLVYLAAFLSWLPQLPGLIGPDGILPSPGGGAAYQLAALVGACAAVAAFAGRRVGPMLAAAWLAYAAVSSGAGEFASFQWDRFLLEAGFLALFLAPWRCARVDDGRIDASATVVWLYRFLLFRVLFLSGLAKLLSGDPAWRDLTALRAHLETQPLPTPLAWSAHQLPEGVLKAAAAGTLAVELLASFLLLMPRRARLVGAAIVAAYELAVIATGNYAFFGWLALALAILAADDAALGRVFRRAKPAADPPPRRFEPALAAVIVAFALIQAFAMFRPASRPAAALSALVTATRTVSAYALFASAPPHRDAVVIEGSADGIEWRAYAFRHAPGDVKRPPPIVAPFHPRLDWQMWFAGASPETAGPWFTGLVVRLLQGSPSVLALLDGNPFPEKPPAYLRATLYRYRFTTPEERALDGAWWRAAMRIELLPPVTLADFQGGPP